MEHERRRSSDFDMGRLETKIDSLIALAGEHKESLSGLGERVTSLETSRTQYRTYFKIISWTAGAVFFILGKVVFFTHRVQVNVPIIPVK